MVPRKKFGGGIIHTQNRGHVEEKSSRRKGNARRQEKEGGQRTAMEGKERGHEQGPAERGAVNGEDVVRRGGVSPGTNRTRGARRGDKLRWFKPSLIAFGTSKVAA